MKYLYFTRHPSWSARVVLWTLLSSSLLSRLKLSSNRLLPASEAVIKRGGMWEKDIWNMLVTVFLFVLGTLTPTGECGVVKRQAFDTFGNVFHSFGELINEPWQPFIPSLLSYIFVAVNLFSTLGQEGGKFVSKQVEVNQPVVETVGNIQSTIRRYNSDFNNLYVFVFFRSDFAQTVHSGSRSLIGNADSSRRFLADNVNLVSNTVGLVSSVSCAVMCPDINNCQNPLCITPWPLSSRKIEVLH